jgi:DNA-binding transcriptional LysR family regulator
MMETRFLQTFLSVVETGSIAETARRLNVTSSAVVQRIRALEDEIGHRLIQRSGHAMEATTTGAAIVGNTRRLLAMEDGLKAAASADLEAGELRIGTIHTALTGIIPDLLDALRRNRPGIDPRILPGQSGDLYAGILDGTLDLAIIVKPHFRLPKSLDWSLLKREPLILIAPPSLTETDAQAILRSEPFIRYDRRHWGGRIVDLYLRRLRIRPKERFEIDSLEAISILVSRRLGVALVPDWPPPWPSGVQVHRLGLPDAPARDIGFVWSRSSNRLPRIRALVSEALALNTGAPPFRPAT